MAASTCLPLTFGDQEQVGHCSRFCLHHFATDCWKCTSGDGGDFSLSCLFQLAEGVTTSQLQMARGHRGRAQRSVGLGRSPLFLSSATCSVPSLLISHFSAIYHAFMHSVLFLYSVSRFSTLYPVSLLCILFIYHVFPTFNSVSCFFILYPVFVLCIMFISPVSCFRAMYHVYQPCILFIHHVSSLFTQCCVFPSCVPFSLLYHVFMSCLLFLMFSCFLFHHPVSCFSIRILLLHPVSCTCKETFRGGVGRITVFVMVVDGNCLHVWTLRYRCSRCPL